jgi:hypothetical protein
MLSYLVFSFILLRFSKCQLQLLDPSNDLVSYWPFNNNYDDIIGGANLFNCINCSLTTDRFGNLNSALSLTSGYMQAPTGQYFSENFSITAWCLYRAILDYERILDFGNGPYKDNVILGLWINKNQLYGQVYNDTYTYDLTLATQPIKLNVWYHVAFVLDGQYGYIYLNGALAGANLLNGCKAVNRTMNFIGRSNWYNYGDQNADAVYDDIKIFNRALNSTEIVNEYNSSDNHSSLVMGSVWAPLPDLEPQAAIDNSSAPFYYDYYMNNLGGSSFKKEYL